MKLLALSCLLLAGAWAQEWKLLQEVPTKLSPKRNPMEGNERARDAGAKLFARECSACHGMNAEGSEKAPSLSGASLHQASDAALFWILKNGSLRHGMPSFAHLPEPERWQIITFLRSLHQREE